MTRFVMILTLILVVFGCRVRSDESFKFTGCSDASAAAFIDSDTFIVADDETNVLRAYSLNSPTPAAFYDLSSYLQTVDEHPEIDIEGAAKIGNRIYWISSHGRNKNGKMRPNRYRFFATDIIKEGTKLKISPAEKYSSQLVHRLIADPEYRKFNLNKYTQIYNKDEIEELAPKEKGLNIEGLAASKDGEKLYIGFRNPRPYKDKVRHALIAVLNNPAAV